MRQGRGLPCCGGDKEACHFAAATQFSLVRHMLHNLRVGILGILTVRSMSTRFGRGLAICLKYVYVLRTWNRS